MNLTNTPRKYLLGLILVMVLILVTITVANPASLVFKDNTDYAAQKKIAEEQTKQYEALLASVEPDYQASQQLLEKIATEDVVRQQVKEALNTNQKVVVPTIPDSQLTFSSRNDKAAVVDYVNRLGSMVANYNDDSQAGISQVFGDNPDQKAIDAAASRTKALAENIRGLPVPKDAAALSKAYLVTYETYNSFLGTAKDYAVGTDTEPWSEVYGQYAVINNQTAASGTELKKLSTKYALNLPEPETLALDENFAFPALIKTAHAQWAVVDVQAAVVQGIKVGLARSFAKFAVSMLDKLVAHIEKSFAIASQLYYSQDLGRYYSVEYMKKFVKDPLDQDIIQKFLPEYFCINPSQKELKKIFTAKAVANQGADIVIDPSDPQFIQKLAKLGGDEKNYGAWWEDYYMTLASQTQQAAAAAATKEVTSNGLKSGRDLATGQINKTMAAIFNTQEAAIAGTINLGTNNTENAIGQIVASVVENLVNKFVFTPIGGGTSGGGGIGVIKETNVCLRTPQMKPVASLPSSTYEAPSGSSSTTTTPINTGTPPFAPR
jgi:hypothetical protein